MPISCFFDDVVAIGRLVPPFPQGDFLRGIRMIRTRMSLHCTQTQRAKPFPFAKYATAFLTKISGILALRF